MKLTKWDPAENLTSPEAVRYYLEEFVKDGDAGEIAGAIDDVARAYGLQKIAADTGIPLPELFNSLGKFPGPELADLLRILEALGVSVAKHSDAAE